MKILLAGILTLGALSFGTVKAQAAPPPKASAAAPGPCMKIAEACQAAGFVKGDWKKGDGLWRDCVDPIVQGKVDVPGATKPLPIVDATTISNCKAKHPKFGAGKVGS